ncbi:MAG: polysaccharide pyruvyl transferase CsaB [Elusimicrobia bacterium]|nr:polysaccharide pyruvyl transferase CsaB [Candidatus Liberimonas magnetica]
MNVLISGYYGFNNLGDELILKSIISELRLKIKNPGITVLSANPKDTASLYNVLSINRWCPFRIVKHIINSNIVILGGGGLFQDITSSLSLYYYLLVIIIAKISGKKIFVYSVNINELKAFNSTLASKALKLADTITVRDKGSLNILESWKAGLKKCELTADPVFLSENIAFNKLKSSPNIAFILRDTGNNGARAEEFASLADRLAGHFSGEIMFIPFQRRNDDCFADKVSKAMKYQNKKIYKWESLEDVFKIYSGLDLIICQRLHGLILASLYAVPFIAISDDEKIINFAKEIDGGLALPLTGLNPDKAFDLALNIYEHKDRFQDNMRRLLPLIKKRAQKTSDILMQLF